MKAAVLHALGDLRVEAAPDPVAEPGRIVVRVGACGICGSDLPRIFKTGTYRFPTIPGHEFYGEVVAVGEDCGGVEPGMWGAISPLIPCGDCYYCRSRMAFHCERYDFLGSRSDGGFAEWVSAPADNLIRVDDAECAEAAAMMEPVAVAYHCVDCAEIKRGDSVVVLGAGPIGNLIAQRARFLGADPVLITDLRPPALAVARRCGLTGIDASSENTADRITEATGGLGADVVVEAAGSEKATIQAFQCVRRRGTVVLIGRIEGDLQLPAGTLASILRKEITVRGVWGFDPWALPRNDCVLALGAIRSGDIQVDPLITHRFPLDRINEALEMMRSGREYYCKALIAP